MMPSFEIVANVAENPRPRRDLRHRLPLRDPDHIVRRAPSLRSCTKTEREGKPNVELHQEQVRERGGERTSRLARKLHAVWPHRAIPSRAKPFAGCSA